MSIKQIHASFRTLFFIGSTLLILPQLALSEPIEHRWATIDVSTLTPTTSEIIYLDIIDTACWPGFEMYIIDVNYDTKSVNVVLDTDEGIGGVCLPNLQAHVPITALTNTGSYVLSIYHPPYSFPPEDLPYFSEQDLIGTFNIVVSESNYTMNPEVPAAGSIQSGVGMVRGWACDAEKIEVAFDDGERIAVAYGTAREDTRSVCGDANNGYGMVIAWGALGHGSHIMKTFINGDEVSETEFVVSGLNDPFIKGLSATYQLDDFPAPDESVIVIWSEAAQNFIIIEQN